MSRFKPSAGGAISDEESSRKAPESSTATIQTTAGMQAAATAPALMGKLPVLELVPELRPHILQSAGFFVLCLYFISANLNDWFNLTLASKAYVSTITVLLLPILLLVSGMALYPMKHRVGKYWAGFLACMLLSTPFSVWRTGSLMELYGYIPHAWLQFFYITAFAVSLRQVRSLCYFFVLVDFIAIATCWKFGTAGEGNIDERFFVPHSMLYGNANDLALALAIAIANFAFLLVLGGVARRIVGVAGILLSLMYMLRTASRGCTLALFALLLIVFWLSKNRLKLALLLLPVPVIVVVATPGSALHRLSLYTFSSNLVGVEDMGDLSTIHSQKERTELFKRSLIQTIQHPVLGVGPDQFVTAENGEAAKRGEWSVWLGTHNSYTQVSSECGIPAFFFYSAVLFLSIRIDYRLYKVSAAHPALKDIKAISFSFMGALVVYAVGTFFFHTAYGPYLPMFAGATIALFFAAKPVLQNNGINVPTVFGKLL